MKATEQYFPVVLFIMLYKVVLTFRSVDEILWCDHSNESYQAALLYGTICFSIFFEKKFGLFLDILIFGTLGSKKIDYCYQEDKTLCSFSWCYLHYNVSCCIHFIYIYFFLAIFSWSLIIILHIFIVFQ